MPADVARQCVNMRLSQEVKRMRVAIPTVLLSAVISAIVSAATVLVMSPSAVEAQPPPRVISAERFEIVDDGGTRRGIFGMLGGQPVVDLVYPDRKGGFLVVLGPDGTTSMVIRGESDLQGPSVATLVPSQGSPIILMDGGDRNVLWSAP